MKNKKMLKCLLYLLVLSSCEVSFPSPSNTTSSSEIESIYSEELSSIESSSDIVVSSESSLYSESISSSSSIYSSSSYYSSVSGFTVKEEGRYTDVESVAMYITTFHKLPSNYIRKNQNDNYWYIGDTKTEYLWRELVLPTVSSYYEISYKDSESIIQNLKLDASIYNVSYSNHEVTIEVPTETINE